MLAQFIVNPDIASPVAKSFIVGTAATVGAVVEQDWKIIVAGMVCQVAMAAITAFAARSRSNSRSNRGRKPRAIPHEKSNQK